MEGFGQTTVKRHWHGGGLEDGGGGRVTEPAQRKRGLKVVQSQGTAGLSKVSIGIVRETI